MSPAMQRIFLLSNLALTLEKKDLPKPLFNTFSSHPPSLLL